MGTIRFLLAIAILCFHTTPLYGNYLYMNQPALETFFIMSGFYMALILTEKYSRKADFYRARALRIFPMYFIFLGMSVVASVAHGEASIAPGRGWPIAAYDTWRSHFGELSLGAIISMLLANLLIFGQDVMMFLKIEGGSLSFTPDFAREALPAWKFLFIPPTWSIALELTFYALAPFLVFRSKKALFALLIGGIILKYFLASWYGLSNDPWSNRFLPSELPLFVLGILGYRFYAHYRETLFASRAVTWCSIGLFAAWIALIVFYFSIPCEGRATLFLCFSALAIPFTFELFKRSRVDQFLGDLSFPIYLSHYSFMLLVIQRWDNLSIYVAPITIAFSLGYHLLIGRRIDNFRHRLSRCQPPAAVS